MVNDTFIVLKFDHDESSGRYLVTEARTCAAHISLKCDYEMKYYLRINVSDG